MNLELVFFIKNVMDSWLFLENSAVNKFAWIKNFEIQQQMKTIFLMKKHVFSNILVLLCSLFFLVHLLE